MIKFNSEGTLLSDLDGFLYEQLMRNSKEFKGLVKMRKADLINRISRRLFIPGKTETPRVIAKDVANKKLNNIQLAYWLYKLEGN